MCLEDTGCFAIDNEQHDKTNARNECQYREQHTRACAVDLRREEKDKHGRGDCHRQVRQGNEDPEVFGDHELNGDQAEVNEDAENDDFLICRDGTEQLSRQATLSSPLTIVTVEILILVVSSSPSARALIVVIFIASATGSILEIVFLISRHVLSP